MTKESLAQEAYFKRYTFEHNLPSSVNYQVFSDSRKFIWVTTDAGLARFDGVSFKVYDSENGIPDNEVFNLSEDNTGRIWFTTLKGKVGSVYQDNVTIGTGVSEIDSLIVLKIFFDRDKNMWLSARKGLIYKIKNGRVIHKWKLDNQNCSSFFQDSTGTIWFTTFVSNELYNIRDNKIYKLLIFPKKENGLFNTQLIPISDGRFLFCRSNYWAIVDPIEKSSIIVQEETLMQNRHIISGMEDEDKNVWIGTSRGVLLFSKVNGSYVWKKSFLEYERVTGMTSDFEGNNWVSTLSGGLYYIPCNPLSVSNYKQAGHSDNISVILLDFENNVFIGNDEGNVFTMNENVISTIYQNDDQNGGTRVTCGIVLKDGSLCFGKDNGLLIIQKGKIQKVSFIYSIKAVSEDINGNLLIGTHADLLKVSRDFKTVDTIANGRVSAIFSDSNTVWFANENGLNKIENNITTTPFPPSFFSYQRISSITGTHSKNIICVSTLGKGIFILDSHKGVLMNIQEKHGLASNYCNKILIDKNSHLWVATKRGINQVIFEKNGSFQILIINHENGIIGDEVNDLKKSGNIIWAATSMGISKFDESAVTYLPVPPPVYVEKVYQHEKPLPLKNNYELSFDETQVKIKLVGLSYMSSGKISYKYKMEGLDSNWTVSNSPIVYYPNLESGSYHFIAKAINSRGEESLLPAEIYFEILPAYWQTLWFKVFVGFIFFILLLASIFLRVKVIKRREEEKTRLNKMLGELEMTALKAQMNPHFIFNSLGSIQNLINRDKKIEANVYLSKFAKLLRMTLDHSDKKEVSLADETNMLDLYLSLEALRFVNKFEYSIEISPEIDSYSYTIPPMMLQPFIENAIKHGLLPKKEDALLKIKFSIKDNDILHCVVEDNGIGRVQREKLKEKSNAPSHISKGIKITKNRLELINQLRTKPAEIRITDLYNNLGSPSGTRIEVFIPMEN